MPRHPAFASSVARVESSVYSRLGHRLDAHEGDTYPLHIGDTYLEPAVGCRMEDLTTEEYPGLHRYTRPHGDPELLEALAERLTERTGQATHPDEILLTAGATGGLGAVAGALVNPGDEVLIAAPFWPLIAGIVRSFHGVAVPVPLLAGAEVGSAEDAVAAFEAKRTDRTVAVYWSTPNNPTGKLLPREWIEALVTWAEKHDLWVLSDDVYEDYDFEGEHVYTRPLAPERVFSAHSFSKAYGMAGNRVGYMVGPTDAMAQVRKVSVHTFYCAPHAGQIAALRALGEDGDEWIARTAAEYRRTGTEAARRLGVEPPQGSTFLFVDVHDHLDDRGLPGFLEDCVDRGLLVAPGPSFGPYPTHVRLCFTCSPPEVVMKGVEVLAGRMGR
jgi:aspartate/methionine/tyrosine aminotransferase